MNVRGWPRSPGRRRSKHKGLREAQPGGLSLGTAGTGSTETLGLSQFAGEGKQWELSPGSGCSLVKVYPLVAMGVQCSPASVQVLETCHVPTVAI